MIIKYFKRIFTAYTILIYIPTTLCRMIFMSQSQIMSQFGNRKLWSSIELYIFQPCDGDGIVITMINTITPLLVLGICDAYVAVGHYNVHRMIFMSKVGN